MKVNQTLNSLGFEIIPYDFIAPWRAGFSMIIRFIGDFPETVRRRLGICIVKRHSNAIYQIKRYPLSGVRRTLA